MTKEITKKEPCIDSRQAAILFTAKCKDLQVSKQHHHGPLQKRFMKMVTNNCINGKLKFGEMKAGFHFAEGIREVLSMD